MKKIISGILAAVMVLGMATMPDILTDGVLESSTIHANAATDAWGREYLTYGDLRYQVQSNNTISIIGFDISKDTVEIPDEIDGMPITKIGNYAFYQAYYVKNIKLPDTVTYIGNNAFYHCYELESVNIPYGVTYIGSNAFDTCEKLTAITLPNTVETIGKYAFTYSGIESIEIPDSVKTMKDRVFYSCPNLTYVKMPSEVDSMGNFMFSFSKKLETVVLPNNITTIPKNFFYYCEGLKNVTIPESVTKVDANAFYYCTSLESINIPENVQTIGESGFEGCSSLKNVDISEGVTTLGKYVFQDCTSLTELVLPKSVVEAGDFCFFGCPNLKLYLYKNSYGVEYALRQISLGCNVNFTTVEAPVNVTGITASSVTDTTVKLTWNKVEDATGYIVYRYDNSKKDWVKIAKSKTNSVSYIASKLSDGTEYKFAVKAYKIVDGYEFSSDKFSYISVTTAPQDVSGFKVSATSANAIKLVWGKVNNADGYVVYRYNTSTKKWVRIAKTASLTFTDKNLNSGTSYKYAIRAYKTVDGKEVLSPSYPTVTTSTNPANVSGFKVSATSASAIKLTWNKTSGANGYIVYRYNTSTKKWVRIAKTASLTFTDKNLKSGTSYKYAIRAYKTVDGKEVLSPSYPTVTSSTNPATVSFKLTAGSKKVTVNWSKVTGATGYKVYYKTSANGKWIGLKTTTGTSYTKTGLTKGKTYYFTVKAYRTVGGKTYNGTFTTKSVKVK